MIYKIPFQEWAVYNDHEKGKSFCFLLLSDCVDDHNFWLYIIHNSLVVVVQGRVLDIFYSIIIVVQPRQGVY
jgi:hypothetical protein